MRRYPVSEEYLERVLMGLRGQLTKPEMESLKNSTRAYIKRSKSQTVKRVVYYNTED